MPRTSSPATEFNLVPPSPPVFRDACRHRQPQLKGDTSMDFPMGDESTQPDDEDSMDGRHFDNRGHDWLASRYFELLESGGRARTPSDFGTDTTSSGDTSEGEGLVRADARIILRHLVYRVLRVIVCTDSRPSDWYRAEDPRARWICPLEGCTHEVDPLWLDAEAHEAVVGVFGALGITTERWTGHSVLALKEECELDTDCCRLSTSREEVAYRRLAMDVIGWSHISTSHMVSYGVTIRDTGCIDPESGLRGVAFIKADTDEILAAYAPGLGLPETDERHRQALERVRRHEVARLTAEAHRLRVILTRWHRQRERFLENAVSFCDKVPRAGREPSSMAGRLVLLGLEQFREQHEPTWAPGRLRDVRAAVVAWESWDLLSYPYPNFWV
ncbi:unnamed protein product [Peniophora sp. CBMAI 1063]|nr:unnamed protein product [Peniophora sp. CBMAI 1063]